MNDWTYTAAERIRKTRAVIKKRIWLARAEVIKAQLEQMRATAP